MRYGFLAAGLLAASVSLVTTAQAASTGAPHIGVVDLQAVIGGSQRGQAANAILQETVKKLQDEVNDRKQKLLVLKQQLDKADSKTSGYDKLQKSYEDGQNDLQQYVLMGRQDIGQRQQELVQPIEQELGQVLSQYAKEHHYDIIFSKNAAGAVFASGKYDITKSVIAAMDADWAKQQKQQKAGSKSSPPGGKGGGKG
ncbi:MAG: OmpH family outer membrane protein [Gammaproteobacteria bacterium]|nr:OmpH family outer membrane protein [Gammaproteobacteria bacterium]